MEKRNKLKKFLKKFWFVVWKDDSLRGWIISLVFLFIIVKFVFFPLLELSTGTKLPLVIVESCSMYHEGNMISNFDNWWEDHETKYLHFNITEKEFREFPLKKGFNKGDILFVVGKKPEKLKIGDIIIFNANYKHPIIHRIVKIEETDSGRIFSTLGDNNNRQLILEKSINQEQIIGGAVVRLVPYLGWVKLGFFDMQKPVSERGLCKSN
ncbi:signal peptidase I [Candidatus Pacearchaeota archaeon ex4484_71]|nr:MAG: signal peptidase I [Candidatus Pacearchaeota archaeon ex4484_71]